MKWPPIEHSKHGIDDEDIRHAFDNNLGQVPEDGGSRAVMLGPDRQGRMLEVVLLFDEPGSIIHADYMRPKFTKYLTRQETRSVSTRDQRPKRTRVRKDDDMAR